MGTPSIIVFDVNETLIDIESIGPFFERKFGDRKVLREWFNQLILYSNVITLSGYYETFFTLGQGSLRCWEPSTGSRSNQPISKS
jgi:2-haloacid dehalogenase